MARHKLAKVVVVFERLDGRKLAYAGTTESGPGHNMQSAKGFQPFKGIHVEAIDLGEAWMRSHNIGQILQVANAMCQAYG
jgi:hypothetical protein